MTVRDLITELLDCNMDATVDAKVQCSPSEMAKFEDDEGINCDMNVNGFYESDSRYVTLDIGEIIY